MADENLLHALAAQERERMQARPQEWDELARGEITPGEAVARVRARGAPNAVAGAVDEGDLVHTRELFTPPSAAFDDALVDRLVAMAQASAPATTEAPQPEPRPQVQPPAPVHGNEVIHVEPSWWQRRRAIVAAGVMAAAAAVLVVAWPRAATDDTGAGRVALPHHEMWIESDAQVRGSGSEGLQRLAPGAALRVYLRPDRGYEVKPSVAACLRKGDETRVLSLQPSAAKPGETFDIATRLPDDLAEGRWELVALVAGGALPSDIAASCAIPPADVQVERKAIDVAR